MKAVSRFFFDRPKILDRVSAGTRRVLNHAGALTRKIARQSIRKRKAISSPGSPPSSHTGLLRDNIFYWRENDSVVIGPTKLNGGQLGYVVPHLLEFGGEVLRSRSGKSLRQRFRARPFMKPALDKVAPQFPQLFKDSVRP